MPPTQDESTTTPAPTQRDRVVAPNFITDIIDRDLGSGAVTGLVTRFPPEPNGYLHIGHAKSICLNFGLAVDYGGITYLRFDDTNPTTENEEYVRGIIDNIDWLGFEYAEVRHASDYFPQLYSYALTLIDRGLAYVDGSSEEELRRMRGTVTEPGVDSPFRDRSPAENRDLFERMRAGEFAQGSMVLRAKIDMTAANMKMRDPILYRIVDASHYRTGREWPIYPLYDFAHPLSDAIEHVTHSLCTLEFENNRDIYDWLLDHLVDSPRPHQYEFARLNLDYTVMSKRKLRKLVTGNIVHGWDDPRMPTLAALRRRGVTPEAIRDLANRVGVAKANSRTHPTLLDHCVRDDLNTRAQRVLAVLDPLDVELTNVPDGHTEWLDAPYWPHDVDREGTRRLPLSRDIVIERDDFEMEPSAGFKRLAPGRSVRLRHGYVVRCDEVVTNDAGTVTKLLCSAYLDDLGSAPEDVKVWATLHWVSRAHALPIRARLYERLFTEPDPEAGGDEFTDNLDRESERIVTGFIEPSVASDDPATRYQFERLGYFWRDPVDSGPEDLVFNRIVALKDGFARRDVSRGTGAARGTRATTGTGAASGSGTKRDAGSGRAGREAQGARMAAAGPEGAGSVPETSPAAAKLAAETGIAPADAEVLVTNAALAALFTGVVEAGVEAVQAANWTINEVAPFVRDQGNDSRLTPRALASLIGLVESGTITQRVAKDLIPEMVDRGADAAALVAERGLARLDDAEALGEAVRKVLAAHPQELAGYLQGKTGLRGFFIGQVMRVTQGRADPAQVQVLIDDALSSAAQARMPG
ncbi:MAG TPA: glutamine--tRNA ligase/YqeY domain fusion protein [Trueperaceae bacterium]|nr:glutamine--tRNA ligase/YqeY domain fusion protein [Trueperaceae bacterium]